MWLDVLWVQEVLMFRVALFGIFCERKALMPLS